ncbi:hypothetical protein GOC46_28865 [Sinorhizobium meliloti]|nr:hypothetical protein [Sinorhizobium meliloti]MDX0384140.1 hypothetical protein [Sinorhizobium meliloti]
MLRSIWSWIVGQRGDSEPLAEATTSGRHVGPDATFRNYTCASLAVGASCILLFAASVSGGESFFSQAGASFALALSALVLGSLLGFVFGIPRTLQYDIARQETQVTTGNETIGYQINTNLEQISDWLTKIIVGVGLVELGSIGSWLMSFSADMGKSFGDDGFGQAFVLGILVYFVCVGFLFGYLWTRLSFGLAVKEADQGLIGRRIEKFEAGVRADNRALLLVTRHLNLAPGTEPGVPQKELDDAVAQTTVLGRVKIFYEAVGARVDDARREQSIPVFRALIATDKQERFHRNYGEIGFALKDQSKPDWEAAESALTKAIEIRDRIGDPGYGGYEFNRAVCRIRLGRPKEEVIADFRQAATDEWVRTWTFNDPAINRWLSEAGISRQSLGFE